MAEATADLKEARARVYIILGAKWPKAANALSRRLKELGPQLRGVGICVIWPTRHGDGRVLKVTNTRFDLNKEKGTRGTSSPSSRRPEPGGHDDSQNDVSWLGDDANQEDELWSRGERSSEHRPGDRPPSFDPDFFAPRTG